MICVSVGRSSHQNMRATHTALAKAGAKLVELRLDWLKRAPDVNALLTDRPTPVIVTCRRAVDRGRWRASEEDRMTAIRTAIVGGAEFIDLEDDIAASVPRFGKTKRIVSHHNFDETPADLKSIHAEMAKSDPDVIKLVTMANSPMDSIRMLELVQSSEIPTVGFCMGEFGTATRVLCGKYGSPWTYASFSSEREIAPGMLSYEQMVRIYQYDSIGKDTEVFGVMGDPIGHSMSPLLHNTAFASIDFNGVYVPWRVPAHQFREAMDGFTRIGIKGLSVTIPLKQEAAATASVTDQTVKDSGASNTLYRDDSNQWRATNTDYGAALETIKAGLRDAGQSDSLAGKRVLLLGCGGVSRAIALALLRNEAIVTVTGRSEKKVKAFANELNCNFVTWENRAAEFADILVNGTPVGMSPNMNEMPYPENTLREGMLVFDTIYNPENTMLIRQARERGCYIATGLEMFVRQAAGQFELFTKQPAPLDVFRETMRRAISPVHYRQDEE